MSLDPRLVRAYLRQRMEHGERELFLDRLTAEEALSLARRAGSGAAFVADATESGRPAAPAAPAPGRPAAGGASRGGATSPLGTAVVEGVREADTDAEGRLRVLGQEAAGCTRCRLSEGRTQVVFGDGHASAEVVVVGEAPGAEEDRTGLPFVGRAGKLLDLLLLSVGLPRASVYICNVLKCRPPDNRDPQTDEVAACSGYLHGQLDLIAPRALITVGKFAAQTLLESESSMGRLRGRIHSYRGIPLVATYHPAYLLRSPQRTRTVWEDLQLVRRILDEQR